MYTHIYLHTHTYAHIYTRTQDVAEIERRLVAVSAHCDYPLHVTQKIRRCTRNLVDFEKMSQEEVETKMLELKDAGVSQLYRCVCVALCVLQRVLPWVLQCV